MKAIIAMILSLVVFASAVAAQPNTVDLHGDDGCYATGAGVLLEGWGVPLMQGGYYGGQNYGTFCLIIEPEVCTMDAKWASFEMELEEHANMITIKYLDGISGADSFNVYINSQYVGQVEAVDSGSEQWKTATFILPAHYNMGDAVLVELEALGPVWNGCPNWGQVAIDYIQLWYDEEIPEFGTLAAIIALVGGLGGLFLLRRK